MKIKLKTDTATSAELAKIKDETPIEDQNVRPRSFSLDDDKSTSCNDSVQRGLLVIVLLFVIYAVVMSTYAVIRIGSMNETCTCSTEDVESALTIIAKKDTITTASPSLSPTMKPSFDPSYVPTLSPSNDPTLSPSNHPTLSPSALPTLSPSVDPTLSTSVNPTLSPSVDPSLSPSIDPTSTPTEQPTVEPTFHPTVEPTLEPTRIPTVEPTFHPTAIPTLVPTSMPVASPRIYGWSDRHEVGDQSTTGSEIQLIFPRIDSGLTGNLRNEYSTSTGLFTAPIEGIYAFTVSVLCHGCTSSHIFITYNGGRHQSFAGQSASDATDQLVMGTIVQQIKANDVVGFVFYSPAAGTKTVKENWYHTWIKWTLVQEL